LRLLLVATAVSSVAACEEKSITLDSGDPSTLEVRVYVDENGNGTFDSGDQGIASVTVTADGPLQLSGETDGSGVVALQGLVPGSYTLSISGSAPNGAVLATAPRPTVVAGFRGGSLRAEFRYAFEPGSITGRLFRDDNENGVFDADADLAAAGIGVSAEGTGGAEITTTTGADGSYSLTGLRPGTYTVTFDLPEDAELVGGDSFTVEVAPGAASTLQAIFTGELLIDISRARNAADGQSVTIEGTVNWAPSFDDRQIFLQDETGGISVFDFGLSDFAPGGLSIGDRVRLTGSRSSFDGEVQIGSLTAFEILGAGAPPIPAQVTAEDIAAGDYQGELVSLNGTVEQVDVLSFGNQMVLLRDEAGETFAVKVDSRTGVEADAWEVGTFFGVTGVLGTDEDEGGTDIEDDHPHRVEVRSEDDVQRGGATTSIADARQNPGATVVVQGVITWVPSFDDRVIFFQDATGGISVFDFGLSDFAPEGGFTAGHLIRMVATVGAFAGETQLGSVDDVDVLGTVAVPSPLGTTGARMNAGENQGELVTLSGTVDNIDVLSFGNQLVTLTDDAGTSFNVYADSRTGVEEGDWTVGSRFRVTGVLGANDDNTPAARVEVRGDDDVVQVAAGTISIAEARGMDGETVTVTGTVNRVLGWTNRQAFIQDETAGITVFTFDGLPALAVGDVVTVTGDIGAFNGEVQIGPESVDVTGQGEAPTPIQASGAQLNQGLFQGQLVELAGTVAAVEVINSFGTQEVTVLDADGASVRVFVDNRTGLSESDWTVGQEVTVVGVMGFFDGNDPGAQLEVILDTDVTFGS
jgi:uncharacterized protein YdeI (BOF family)